MDHIIMRPVFVLLPVIIFAFSALTLLVWHQEEHLACKKSSDEMLAGHLSAAKCKWFAYGPANATATHHPLLH